MSDRDPNDYMLLCGSCNRAKSWSCEHCENWLTVKKPEICNICYWASPEHYKHIALRAIRRLDVVWSEDEVGTYDQIQEQARAANESLPHFVKDALRKHLEKQ